MIGAQDAVGRKVLTGAGLGLAYGFSDLEPLVARVIVGLLGLALGFRLALAESEPGDRRRALPLLLACSLGLLDWSRPTRQVAISLFPFGMVLTAVAASVWFQVHWNQTPPTAALAGSWTVAGRAISLALAFMLASIPAGVGLP